MRRANPRRINIGTTLVILIALWAGGCGPQADGKPQCAEEGEACTENSDCCDNLFCSEEGACVAEGGGEGEGEGEGEPPGELVQSNKARVTSPAVPDADLAELVAGNSAFAFDLYQQLRQDDEGNIFYSPFSISIALAMTYAGARNETERQMAETLHFTLPQGQLHPAFNALDLELASRGETDPVTESEGFKLNIVNRPWGQIGYAFLQEFLDVLAENYGAGMSLLDFGAYEEARIIINEWVAEQTEDRIEDLIPPGAISDDTRLVLTNAIYFKAAWQKEFDEALTTEGSFNLLDGAQVAVEMMSQVETFRYASGDGYQAVELSYQGGELSMIILLPDAGRFDEFDASLDRERVDAVVQALEHRDLDLTMPKFTFEWDTSLRATLSTMGMPIAFGDADFSGMTGTRALAITDVIHKAFVAVDEEGTEAAAATAVIIGEGAAPEPEEPLIVTIDRPFVFLIRDIPTGTVLFAGRVLDPTS